MDFCISGSEQVMLGDPFLCKLEALQGVLSSNFPEKISANEDRRGPVNCVVASLKPSDAPKKACHFLARVVKDKTDDSKIHHEHSYYQLQ